jgi:hypothetical protein
MKRQLFTAAAALLIAATIVGAANAARPHQFKETFSAAFVSPAGERCDFDQQIAFTVVIHDTVFDDLDNPSRVISRVTAYVSHTNLDTGYTLTEVDRTIQTLNFEKGVEDCRDHLEAADTRGQARLRAGWPGHLHARGRRDGAEDHAAPASRKHRANRLRIARRARGIERRQLWRGPFLLGPPPRFCACATA